jgi:predicted RNA-binding protein
MKTTTTKTWLAIWTSVLMATAGQNAFADQPATAAQPEKNYTGTVVSVEPKEHLLNVKGGAFSKKEFNLGQNCAYVLLDKNPADISDVRAGQKVIVSYQDSHGVLIAGRIQQEPMRYEGMVKAMDADRHMLTLHASGSDKEIQLADDCQVILRNGKLGTFPDIKVGNHVTVTYEKPGDKLTAHQIAQTSVEFTGTLTAIDLEARTVKAKATFASKKFNLADNCAIVINGKPDGRLGDLRPNDRLVFSYDEINGINVANRIAPVDAPPANTNSVAVTAPMTY